MKEKHELPVYPLATSDSPAAAPSLRLDVTKWMNGRFRLLATPDVGWHGFTLFCLAMQQRPTGTLPDDDRSLAALLGLDLAVWLELRGRALGPLDGWYRCLADDGERRLTHPLMLDQIAYLLPRKKGGSR